MTSRSGEVETALAWLERRGTRRVRDDMLNRYGIVAPKAFGVPVGAIKQYGTRLGRNHELALALWDTGWYEARILAAFVDDPALVTAAQMDRWARDFDNWGICDTVCFHLFDKTPHAWRKLEQWSGHRDAFVKRAAFALLASLALHDKQAADAAFLKGLRLVEKAAPDDRHFVKKGVSWGFRVTGRRNAALNEAAVEVAKRLSESPEPSARWLGKEAFKELTSPMVRRRLKSRKPARAGTS